MNQIKRAFYERIVGMLKYGEFEEDEEKHIYHLGGRVYVHLIPWKKE